MASVAAAASASAPPEASPPAEPSAKSAKRRPFQLADPPPALSRLPETSVWLEMTPLADLTGSLNLGQGFPDWSPPSFLLDAVDAPPPGTPAAEPLLHQYSRSKGDPLLVRTIAEQYSARLFPSAPHAIDPLANVLVTVGASHALSLGIGALCGPGDEAVLIEPAFDCYTGAVLVAGATPVYVPLRPRPDVATRTSADFKLDVHELAAAMTPRTRLLVLNSPHNPTGKVFSRGELKAIALVLDDWPHVAVLSDEVYEHMTFNPELPHVSFASLSEDAFARTISIFSIGKTFTATGWKIGWVVGPAPLINRLHALHQFSVFSCASTLQRAVALALVAALEPYKGFPSYYKWLAAHYKKKRDRFVDILDSSPGLDPVVPDGAFYVMARHSSGDYEYTPIPEQVAAFISSGQLKIDPATQGRPDYNFVRKLAVDRRVVGIPPSAFFCASHRDLDLASNFVRFAFCKEDPVLEESRRRLCGLLD